jgi:hypothetical protein
LTEAACTLAAIDDDAPPSGAGEGALGARSGQPHHVRGAPTAGDESGTDPTNGAPAAHDGDGATGGTAVAPADSGPRVAVGGHTWADFPAAAGESFITYRHVTGNIVTVELD